jgi:sugar/nucleoside kinase (ribokinase family)
MLNDKKIVLAGHICLDITPVFLSNKFSIVEQMLSPGKLINIGAASTSTGGSVANTGLAMKFFCIDVSLMGKVGDDIFGQSIIDILKKHSAEKDLIIDEASTTSYSLVMAFPEIDRIFLHHPGANDTFCSQDIGNDKLDGVDLFHFGYPPLMKNMYKDSGSEIIKK